jgi:hypothetical protein
MKRSILVFLFFLADCVFAQTRKTVFPLGFENQPGNSQEATFSGIVPTYQELFRASSLATAWQTPVEITAVAFRVGEGGGPFDATIRHVEIRLSTSAKAPEQMVQSYFSNRGADERVVFVHDNVPILTSSAQPLNPFEVKFQFDTPFRYDPALGHLLMYIANTGPAGPVAHDQSLDSHLYGDVNPNVPIASFGGGGFSAPVAGGLVTEFTWTTVPEPEVTELLFIGALVGGIQLLRKRRPDVNFLTR